MSRTRTRFGGLGAAIWLAVVPTAIGADEDSTAPGVTSFFSWAELLPSDVRLGLEAFEAGRDYEAIARLTPVVRNREPSYARDEAEILRGLSLVRLGWEDLAISALTGLLAAREPGPYYALALLEVVEIHHRAGRPESVASAYGRFVDRAWASADDRSELVLDRLFAFGQLRSGSAELSRKEKQYLARPEELAVRLESRRERASDRVVYLGALALLELRHHAESLQALRRIGIRSPYYPYALYAMAQNEYALGRLDEAERTLRRLRRFPALTVGERSLETARRLLRARIAFATGGLDDGLRASRPWEGQAGPDVKLLLSAALVDAGEPALALAYQGIDEEADDEDAEDEGDDRETPRPEVDAHRALVIAEARAALGDRKAAGEVLREAAERLREARASTRGSVAFLRELVGEQADLDLRIEHEWRARISFGLRRVLVREGPWNLRKLASVARTTLGAPAFATLAAGDRFAPDEAVSGDSRWLAYLRNAHRPRVERGHRLARKLEASRRRSDLETALRVIDAYGAAIERAPREVAERSAARLSALVESIRSAAGPILPSFVFDPTVPVGPRVREWRRRWVLDARFADRLPPSVTGLLEDARRDALTLVRAEIDRDLERILAEEDGRLQELGFELERLFADVLQGESGIE